jgi:FkbM family methyltransferase
MTDKMFNIYKLKNYSNTKIEFEEPNYFQKNDFGTFSLVENIITQKTTNKIVVQINTLDWFLEYYNIPKVHLLKIDAEGMDIDVLVGASKTIQKHFPIIFVEHSDNRKSVLNELKQFLDQFEYSYNVIGNNLLCKPQ